MTKTISKGDVIAVIKRKLMDNLEDLKEDDLDPSKPMKDYGANSLDIIEVVSTSMRELNIKIPRAELANITTLDQLADKFVEFMDKKS